MRKLNILLTAGIAVSLLIHGVGGALRLLGGNAAVSKAAAYICLCFTAAHLVLGICLTVKTCAARKRSGAGYLRGNELFWIRRISGFALLIPLAMHLMIFSSGGGTQYRLKEFTTGRMISQILMIAAAALHVISNIRPLLIGLGVRDRKGFGTDILLVLSAVLLLCAVSFAVYYLRWAAY